MMIERTNLLEKIPSIKDLYLDDLLTFNTAENKLTLQPEKIYRERDIKKLCVDYRLRFLDAQHYKLDFPSETSGLIQEFENTFGHTVSQFKIVAPSKAFILKKSDDPLLFADIGNGKYYLIHQWGRDLSPFRKLQSWPFKNFFNLCTAIFVLSLFTSLLIGPFTAELSFTNQLLLFLFILKSMVGVVLYYCFASGFQFSESSWQSPYQKAL